jgi:hypothetical protein
MTLVGLVGLAVGVPLGAALLGLSIRLRFARTPGAFRCKVRVPRTLRRPHQRLEPPAGFGTRWGHRRTRAVWVHDVLLVQHGLLGQRVVALPVRTPDEVIRSAPADVVPGLGPSPQVLRLRLDEGPPVEVATTSEARSLVVGPFMAAAIPGLPTAPADRPPAAGEGGRR